MTAVTSMIAIQSSSPSSLLCGQQETLKNPDTLVAKSRARSSCCCGLALFHGLVPHTGLTSLRLPPPPWTELSKKKIGMTMIMTLTKCIHWQHLTQHKCCSLLKTRGPEKYHFQEAATIHYLYHCKEPPPPPPPPPPLDAPPCPKAKVPGT